MIGLKSLLMMSYLRKFLSRTILLLLLIFIIILAISILVNNLLTSSRDTIEQGLSDFFNQNISIESISFSPPNLIILKNVYIREVKRTEKSQPFSIKRIKCMLSLPALIFKRNFIITNITLDKPRSNYFFIKKNFKEILEAINSLTQEQPLKIVIKQALLDLSEKGKFARWITLDSSFKIEVGKSLSSLGSISLGNLSVEDGVEKIGSEPKIIPLDYSFKAFLTNEGLMIENFEVKGTQFYMQLWGILEENVLTMNGCSSFVSSSEATLSSNNLHSMVGSLSKIILHPLRTDVSDINKNMYDFNIYDLACVIKLGFPSVYIENFSFSLKDTLFRLKGAVSLKPVPTLNLSFSSFPNQPKDVRLNNPKRFDMTIAGTVLSGKFNGTVNLDFLKKTKTKTVLERIENKFKNLALFDFVNEKIKVSFDQLHLSYLSGGNLYNIFMKDFTCHCGLKNRKVKFLNFNSMIYDGFLEGEGLLDITQEPPRSSFDIKITDVSADRLHGLLAYCSKIYGKFSSQIHYRSHPYQKLIGKLIITNGLLDNIIFFNWVADFLQIPSLKKINFDSLSTEFIVTNESIGLKKINLYSKDLASKGNFTLYENDLVSSKLSLVLSKVLLKSSPKFSRLIKYLRKDTSTVSFNFQLSGLFHAMNFKWLESDFKQKLQELLPSRMEKRIEDEVEIIMESISGE